MTVSLHKLTAGDGYTYLTRQVAASDGTDRGYRSLGDYYAAKGESPGQWWGTGLAALGTSGQVTEQQMLNLFGQGIHPDADRIRQEQYARGATVPAAVAATKLGRTFPVHEGSKQWRTRLAERYEAWNRVHGHPHDYPVPVEERTRIRTDVARDMFAELHGREPLHAGELSGFVAQQSRPETSAVAGFDLTFSPVKSVSTLWAVAPREVSERIEAAHDAAVTQTLQFLETEAGYTRIGSRGVAQVDITGFVAARFTHRDSRAGDPDLHTHVAISNKVQTVDGRWLALDARMLYRMTVAGSEFYNTALEAEVTTRIGGRFTERAGAGGKRPIRELAGVDERLNSRWSSRRRAIEAVVEELSARFVADHGRVPTTVESLRLAQQATLATRDRKHEPRSLGEQRTTWRREALEVLGGPKDLDAMVTAATTATMDAAPVDRELLTEVSAATVRVLEQGRARWRENHVLAEATRQTRAASVDPTLVNTVAAEVTARLLMTGGDLVPVGVDTELAGPDAPAVPAGLRRVDGSSVFRVAKAQLFTTPAVLDAEQRIITAAGRVDGRRVSNGDVELAMLEWSANTGGRTLNTAQRQMITEVATGGRRVHLALAPAGTGKTTVMGVLAKAWQNAGGTVVGLAPQASAAEELRDALTGVVTDTLDKLVHELTERADTDRPDWVRAVNPGTLVIVDEAGLASTRNLDTTIGYVTARGGRVLLVGDDRQRAAAGAGGVLRDIDAAHGCSTLVEVMRFTNPTEGQASLAVRAGDPSAVGFYADHQRLHPVTSDTGIDTLYRAWTADVAAGRDSIMMAPTLDLVSQLNHRARTDRLTATGGGESGLSGAVLVMGNGDTVSAGDLIVTKKNNRYLRLGGGTDFVQNNHRFTITQVNPDGSLDAVLIGRGTPVRLPAEYIAQGHVRLGYAHTLASCQGITVGAPAGKHGPGREGTAHALLTPGMTRNEVYPAMTRGVTANHAYIDTGSGSGGAGGDPHRVITPDAVTPHTINELFAEMIGRDGGNRSATTEQRESTNPALLLGQAADAYTHAIVAGAETLIGPDELARIDAEAEQAVPGVTTAPAWETLRGHLAVRAVDGNDPVADLRHAAKSREMDTAIDLAAVLDYRLDKTGNHSQRPGPLPWLPAIPARLAEQPDRAPYLTARGEHVQALAAHVRELAATWTTETAPKWAAPYLHNPALVGDLAVWRAAESVDPDDLRPAGPRPRRIAIARRHTRLVERCVKVAGNPTDGADRWVAVLTRLGITDIGAEDYWPVLAGRLTLADTAGLPIPALLADAAARGPLPTENRAAALWWRLSPHLGGVTAIDTGSASQRVRPAWTSRLEELLGVDAVEAVTGDRLWPVLVARVDTAAANGTDPEHLITDAAGMLAPALPTLRTHQYATGLLLHISTLADPEPTHPNLDVDLPPDPADQDLLPPPDLHDHQLPVDKRSAYDVPNQMPGLLVEPVDDTTAPVDPVTLLTAAPDQTVDGAALGRAREAVAAAWPYYQQQNARSWAPQYLTGRGLEPAVAGYAPAGWTKLVDHLQAQGFTRDEVLAAGLARTSNRDGALIDRFSNRVILPIHDTTGTITAFVGRKHPTDTNPNAPKYVNSPTTDLFHKTDLPYGLSPGAIEKLRGGADLVLVEGPLDAEAITLTAAGHGLDLVAVAPLGTALTAEQLSTIDSLAPLTDRHVIVALDNDPAGIKASRTALTLLTKIGITNPQTIALPEGQDPAQILADHGPAELAAALTDRRPLVELVVDDITRYWQDRIRPGGWGIEEGFHALQEAAPLIARLPEPERQQQAEHLAAAIHFDPFTVMGTIEKHLPYRAEFVGDLQLPGPPVLRTPPADRGAPPGPEPAAARTDLSGAIAGLAARVQQLQTRTAAALSPSEQVPPRTSRDDGLRRHNRGPGPGIGL